MKFTKILTAFVLTATMLSVVTSCDDDKDTLSRAVMVSVSTLSFDGYGGYSEFTVYADADWFVEDVPDWITLSATTGTGVVDVEISVPDNYLDGALNTPRSATLIFKGKSTDRQGSLRVSQDGDKYRNLQEYKVSDVYGLADEDVLSLPNVYVCALSTDGYMIANSDFATFVYVSSNAKVSVGDELSIIGDKSSSNSLPIVLPDTYEVISTGNSVSLPNPTDITSQIDNYNSTTWDYVSVEGLLNASGILSVQNAQFSVNIVETESDILLTDDGDSLYGHVVVLTGFYAGVTSPYVRLIALGIEDVKDLAIFREDFEWIEPWATSSGAGDQVTTGSSSANAPSIYGYSDLVQEFADRGYTFTFSGEGSQCIYMQTNYLYLGTNNSQAAFSLPSLEDVMTDSADITLTFNWCPRRGGTYVWDTVSVMVYVGSDKIATFNHSYSSGLYSVDENGALKWIDATLSISNYVPDRNHRISFVTYLWDKNRGSANAYYRWYLDNIFITEDY